MHVANLSSPVLDVDLPTLDVVFDDVRTLSDSLSDLPAGGHFTGTAKVVGDTNRSSTVDVNVGIIVLAIDESTLTGKLALHGLDAPRFTADLSANMLNVDKLRAAFGGSPSAATSSPSSPSAKDDNPHGLSNKTRARLATLNGTASLKAKKAIVKGIPVSDFDGKLTMNHGVLAFDTLRFGLYGGTMTATGTLLDLPSERTGYTLHMKGEHIDLGTALAAHTGIGKVFSGSVSPSLDVVGKGIAAGDFAATLEGPAQLVAAAMQLVSLDLMGPLVTALKAAGVGGNLVKPIASVEKGTQLKDVNAALMFHAGKMTLQKPMESTTPYGKLSVEGGASLDDTLDLKATLHLTPQTLSQLTSGHFAPKDAVPVPLHIGGSWEHPIVSGLDVGAIAKGLLGSSAQKAADVVKDTAKDVAKDAVGKVLSGKPPAAAAKDAAQQAADAAKGLADGLFGGTKKPAKKK